MKLPALQAPNTFWITRLLNNLSQLQLITLHDQNCQIQFYKIDLWLPFLTTIPLLLVIAESSLIFLVNECGFHLKVHKLRNVQEVKIILKNDTFIINSLSAFAKR